MASHDQRRRRVPADDSCRARGECAGRRVFHVATWFFVLGASIAAILAWRQGRLAPNWSFHFGLVLLGWGIFNVVEGVVNHHVLRVHHVRDDLGAPLSWDIGFLVLGVLLIAAGWSLHRRGLRALEREAARDPQLSRAARKER